MKMLVTQQYEVEVPEPGTREWDLIKGMCGLDGQEDWEGSVRGWQGPGRQLDDAEDFALWLVQYRAVWANRVVLKDQVTTYTDPADRGDWPR